VSDLQPSVFVTANLTGMLPAILVKAGGLCVVFIDPPIFHHQVFTVLKPLGTVELSTSKMEV
jgi:hypothetical protein